MDDAHNPNHTRRRFWLVAVLAVVSLTVAGLWAHAYYTRNSGPFAYFPEGTHRTEIDKFFVQRRTADEADQFLTQVGFQCAFREKDLGLSESEGARLLRCRYKYGPLLSNGLIVLAYIDHVGTVLRHRIAITCFGCP
ncbi:MAG TPA: hypothetical protein VMF90_05135 [Rhizobiaceae bacterium]|nr:hypothetical protein [Rhizobiaceae bacterium]